MFEKNCQKDISISTALPEKLMTFFTSKRSSVALLATLKPWLLCWEIYPITLIASFLRIYQLNTTEFDGDQADIFQMARYAVTHGFIPATGNVASLHYFNPAATIDFFMLPAALSNDPLWGAIMIGMLMTVAVLLTYGFVRCYYGRGAATIAALTYATLFQAVIYSRFIWNPTPLPIFVVLFVMALFRGVVARRKGWLFPALLLLGILIQLHPSAVMIVIPLVVALVLAPGTICWHDLTCGLLSLLILFSPYLVWEISIHFGDLSILMQAFLHSQQKAAFNDQAWLFYQALFNPYDMLSQHKPVPHLSKTSLFWQLAPALTWISIMLIYLVVASLATILVLVTRTWGISSHREQTSKARGWKHVRCYWLHLRDSPERCGLLVLLSWQILPIIFLLYHSIPLVMYYFMFFLPGPFILLGIFLAKTAEWLQSNRNMAISRLVLRDGVYALAGLIIIAQFIGSAAAIQDIASGNYGDGFDAKHGNAYNDLRSLRTAVREADQLAQHHHLNRVYIAVGRDSRIQASLSFLSTQMHTPATVMLNTNCVALPSPIAGPAVLLVGPYSDFTNALITHFATATLVDQPRRPGGAPFRLYIVTSKPEQATSYTRLGQDLQLDASSQSFRFNKTPWLVTRGSLLRSASPGYHQTYVYTMTSFSQDSHQNNTTSQCVFTAMRAGDQVLFPFQQHLLFTGNHGSASPTIKVKVQFYETNPLYLHYGPLTFLTFANVTVHKKTLYMPKHKPYLTVKITSSKGGTTKDKKIR